MRSNLIFFGFMMNDFWQKRIGKVDHRSSHAELLSGFSCFGSNTPVFTSTLKALNDLGLRSSPASSHTLSSSAPLHPHHMNLLSVPWPHTACAYFMVLVLTVPSARNALSSSLGMGGSTPSCKSGLTYHLLRRPVLTLSTKLVMPNHWASHHPISFSSQHFPLRNILCICLLVYYPSLRLECQILEIRHIIS